MANATKKQLSRLLALAIHLSAKGHLKQLDKGDNAYILHPLRLMHQFTDIELMIIAVLHDLIEDTDISLDDLIKYGFTTRVILALDALTHRKGETYYDYVLRIAANADATAVKKADLKDNSDITRLKNPRLTTVDMLRLEKYANTYQFLSGRIGIDEYREIMEEIRLATKEAKEARKQGDLKKENDERTIEEKSTSD